MGQSLSSLSSSSGTRLGFDSSSPVIGFRDYSDQERHLLRLLRARAAGAPDPPLANSNDFDSAQQDQDNDPAAPTSPSAAPAIDALSPRDLPAPLSTLLLHHSFAANDLVPIDTVVAILRQYLVAIPSLPPSPATLRHRDAPLVTSASIRHVSATDEALLMMTSMDDDLSSSLSSSLSEASLASSNNPPQRIQQQQLQRSSRGSAGRAAVSPLPHPSLVRGHPSPHLSSKLSLGIGINADDSMSPSLFSLTLPDVLPLRMSDLDSQINVGLCSKGLVQLTPWIAHVKNATVLQLCCNSLSTLPPHIAHLQHLTVLSVAKNLLTWLPLELGHLTQLVELDVSHNRLTDLPASLGHLRKLHILRVDHNRITKLPRALGRLANLVSLDVSDNPLTTLPAELARLKHLRKLRTRNCPLTQLASHSPMALGTPDPPSRVPTLRELAARKLVATNATLDLAHLPRDLAAYLVSYDNCAFCSGPMFDHRVVRSRKFMKNDHVLPLEFELCSSHWSTERERIKALFSTPTSSTTRDAAEAAWREARRVFFAKPAAQSAVATAASSPAMQPARTGSPKPPSLFGFASSPVLSPVAGPALVPPTPRSRTPSMPWISLSRSRKHTAASNTPDLPTSPSLGSLLSPEFAHASTPTLAPSTPTLVAGYLAAADYYTPAPHAQEVEAHMADVFDLVSTTSSGALLPMAGPITALAAIRRMPLLPPVPARYPPPHPPPATSTSTAHAPNTPTMRSSLSLPASPRLNKRSMSVPQLPRSVTTSALGFITRSRTPTPAPSLPMVDEAAAQDLMVPPRVPSGAGWRDDDAGEIEIEIEVAPAPALVQQHATAGAAAFPDLAARTSVTPPASVYGSDVGVAAEQEEEAEAEADSSFKSMASHRSSRLGGWVARVSRLGGRWGSRRASASGASAAGAAAGDEVEGVERAPSLMAAQAE